MPLNDLQAAESKQKSPPTTLNNRQWPTFGLQGDTAEQSIIGIQVGVLRESIII